MHDTWPNVSSLPATSKSSALPAADCMRIELPLAAPGPILAVGAESKGAFCLVEGKMAWLSDAFGSLLEPSNFRRYQTALRRTATATGRDLRVFACDLHPQYLSRQAATYGNTPMISVQHHHAHMAACMAEHGITGPVIGVCCDGAGYGTDGASWGCEVLYATPAEFTRIGHLRYFGLPGSDAAAAECWRPAWSLVRQAYGADVPAAVRAQFAGQAASDLQVADALLARGVQSPLTSSLGRLFDAVAYLLGICRSNTREADAARRLQAAAEDAQPGWIMPNRVLAENGCRVLDFAPAIRAMMERKLAGADVRQLAADFHETIAAVIAGQVISAASAWRVNAVVLSGGCMANRLLVRLLKHRLASPSLSVFEHVRVPCSDAGLPLGQAYISAARQAAWAAGGC